MMDETLFVIVSCDGVDINVLELSHILSLPFRPAYEKEYKVFMKNGGEFIVLERCYDKIMKAIEKLSRVHYLPETKPSE